MNTPTPPSRGLDTSPLAGEDEFGREKLEVGKKHQIQNYKFQINFNNQFLIKFLIHLISNSPNKILKREMWSTERWRREDFKSQISMANDKFRNAEREG